jgi:putative flippase GtrA
VHANEAPKKDMNVASQLHVRSSVGETSSTSPQIPRSRSAGGTGWVRWFWLRLSTFITRHSTLLTRFIKFCLVGGSGVFVDMGVLFLLADPRTLGLNITSSKICAAEIALINNFIWNELWTFRASIRLKSEIGNRKSQIFRRFLVFNAICGIGIGLSVLLLHLFHTWRGWNLYLSNLLAILLVTCWNFGLNCTLNWRDCGMASGNQKKTTMKG